jgi:predicted nucleic acid-binding protein
VFKSGKAKKIKTPDAIIAATAIALNAILLTNNEKDFQGIKRLKVLNPQKLAKAKAKS